MPRPRRERVEPTDDWQQPQLLSRFPEQRTYELLWPVVLFGHSPAERARQTGVPERTLYRQAARFETHGMASLFALASQRQHRLPEEIRQAIRIRHPDCTYTGQITWRGVVAERRRTRGSSLRQPGYLRRDEYCIRPVGTVQRPPSRSRTMPFKNQHAAALGKEGA